MEDKPDSGSGLWRLLTMALNVIRPAFMKLIVALAAVAFAAFAYIGRESAAGYLIPMFMLLLLFALLALASEESERRYRYSKRTEEALKKALREVVQESLIAEQRASETSKKDNGITTQD